MMNTMIPIIKKCWKIFLIKGCFIEIKFIHTLGIMPINSNFQELLIKEYNFTGGSGKLNFSYLC